MQKLITIKMSEIIEEFEVCPYCGYDFGEKLSCCGENHTEKAYRVSGYDLDWYLESEVLIIDG